MFKRLFDWTISLAVLVLAAPLLAVIAAAVWVTMGRPVLFRQVRPGLRGRLFTIYKFRTMAEMRGADGRLLDDQTRTTPLGRFLRRTRRDEMVELCNILRGDMSFVGPRPLLPEYLERFTPHQAPAGQAGTMPRRDGQENPMKQGVL